MAQYALPNSDITIPASFTNCAGGAAATYTDVDEGFGAGRGSGSGPDDDTTIVNNYQTTVSFIGVFGLQTVTDPVSSTGHIMRARIRKCTTTACGASTSGAQKDVTLVLREGGTDIATHTEVNVNNYVTQTYTLSAGEANSISNYANLQLGCYQVAVGGGSARHAVWSALEFECPSAGATAYTLDVLVGSYAVTGTLADFLVVGTPTTMPPKPVVVKFAVNRAATW